MRIAIGDTLELQQHFGHRLSPCSGSLRLLACSGLSIFGFLTAIPESIVIQFEPHSVLSLLLSERWH
jgi:hypothetical protein